MTNHERKNSVKMDFSKFKISNKGAALPVTQKVITRVPVSKPGKQQFVRISTDPEHTLDCAILTLEGDDPPYLLSPSIASLVAQDLKIVCLRLTIDRQGNVSLWPVPPIPDDGAENTWNSTQRQVAAMAETQWIRLSSNRAVGCYEAVVAQGDIPEPIWPDLSFEEILSIAFGSTHVIEDRNHPALQRLWGLE